MGLAECLPVARGGVVTAHHRFTLTETDGARIISTGLSIADLVIQAAIRFGIRPVDIYGRSTLRIHAWPRQWVMFEARQLGHSFPLIGRELGLHHTTVIYGAEAETQRRAAQG